MNPSPTPPRSSWRSAPEKGGGWSWLGVLLLGAGGLLALLAWLLFGQSRKVLVAITSWPGYEYFYLAEQKQLARPHGLELVVKQYSSLADQRAAYVQGELNVMATTLPEAIAVCQERPQRCPLLVLVLDESLGADRLMARRELTSPAQLRGMRVGLERTVLAEYLLLRSFEGLPNLGLEQLDLRFDGPVALVRGLQAGDLDAIVTYAPHDIPLAADGRFAELFSSRRLPGEIVDVLAVSPEFARSRAGDVRALVRTWWAAQDFARRLPTEAVAEMAQRQQITPEQFRQSEQGLRYPDSAKQLDLLRAKGPVERALAGMAAQMRQAGRIEAAAPLPRTSTGFLVTP